MHMDKTQRAEKPASHLRRGWTTGACATAAVKAALTALLTGEFPDPVMARMPNGEEPAFALASEKLDHGCAAAGIIKDAGDDPDVTHGALIVATVRFLDPGTGIVFRAGAGVGTVTLPGLPVAPGEAAINPVPRAMMRQVVEELCASHDRHPDVEITLSVPGGAKIAERTWNPRLGILGGISILGTTGIVHPFSCSAWIHSIRRGIDVSRANGIKHVLGATGSTSEKAACSLYDFPEIALLDMGDFAGGLLKYLRDHPIPQLTIAGGFAKMAKLAKGELDLHSGRSQVDMEFLSQLAVEAGLNQDIKKRILDANSALEVLELTRENGIDIASRVAQLARATATDTLRGAPVAVEVLVVDRGGSIIAQSGLDG
jgi:cobalt-precorrin-5B (C1)-methyltransferase